jgi:hypothetical protein
MRVHHLLLAFSILLPLQCSKKSDTKGKGFTSATAKIQKSGTNLSLPTTTALSTLSAISFSPAPLPLPTDTQTNISAEELSLIEATYGNAPPSNIPTLQAALACKVQGASYLYDPITGCQQTFTNQEKQNCSDSQWSDILGCLPTNTTAQEACSNKNLYWVGGACYRASGLSASDCIPANGENLQFYSGLCFNNPIQVDCLQSQSYWFSNASPSGGSCLTLADVSKTQALCVAYSPLLQWDSAKNTCILTPTSNLSLSTIAYVPKVTGLAGVGSPACANGEVQYIDQSGGKLSVPSGCYPKTPIVYGTSGGSLSDAFAGSAGAAPLLCSTPYSQNLVMKWYACNCNLLNGTKQDTSLTFTCQDTSNTSINYSYHTVIGQYTNYGVGPTTANAFAIIYLNNGKKYNNEQTAVIFGPEAVSNAAQCNNSNVLCQFQSSCPASQPYIAGSLAFKAGYREGITFICASANTPASTYLGQPCLTSLATRNSDGSCSYTSLQTTYQANQQLPSTPRLVGVPDSGSATTTLCQNGSLTSFSQASPSSMAMTIGSCGTTPIPGDALTCGTDLFSSLTIYSNETQIVGYTLSCQNSSHNLGTTPNISTDPLLSNTLTCPPLPSLMPTPVYQSAVMVPVGIVTKGGFSPTQVGLVCGAWVIY